MCTYKIGLDFNSPEKRKPIMEQNQDQQVKYGGCEGPDAMFVKLVSYDSHEFIIKRDYALTSGTIKAMLSGPGTIDWAFGKSYLIFISSHTKTLC
jgi:hypothetical protein